MNAWKHGERSGEAVERRAMLAALIRLLREEATEEREASDWIDMPSDAG